MKKLVLLALAVVLAHCSAPRWQTLYQEQNQHRWPSPSRSLYVLRPGLGAAELDEIMGLPHYVTTSVEREGAIQARVYCLKIRQFRLVLGDAEYDWIDGSWQAVPFGYYLAGNPCVPSATVVLVGGIVERVSF